MSNATPPEFFSNLRVAIEDARVDYRFEAGPVFHVTMRGSLARVDNRPFAEGLTVEIVFDTSSERGVLVHGETSATVLWPTRPADTPQIVEMITLAQGHSQALLVDIDLGSKPLSEPANHWPVTDLALYAPNLLA